jgi:PAS domain S-box-containing protein
MRSCKIIFPIIARKASAFVLLALFMLAALHAPAPAGAARASADVLVLFSYHAGQAWTDDVRAGIERGFAEAGPHVRLTYEFMDSKRVNDPEYRENLLRLYRHKFAVEHFDAAICVDNNAFDFLREHGDELLPSVPVVFCGVNGFSRSMLRGHPQFTGVVEQLAYDETLDIILELLPEVGRIVVYGDGTPTWKGNVTVLEEVHQRLAGRVDLDLVSAMDAEEILRHIRTLGPGDAAVLSGTFRDGSGHPLGYRRSAALVCEASAVPVFGVWDFQLGNGVVGGRMTSGPDQGRLVAELTRRVLDGEAPSRIPVVLESPARTLFDHHALERFGLLGASLPPGAEVRNEPISFYSQNRLLVHLVGSLLAAMLAIIVMLLIHLVHRRRTHARLARSERTYRSIFNIGNEMILVHDVRTGEILDANEAARHLLGYDQEELREIGLEGISAARLGFTGEEAVRRVREAVRSGSSLFEWACQARDGNLRWFEVALRHGEINGVPRVLAVMRNITERREAEADMRRVLDHLPVPVVVYGTEHIEYVNRRFTELFGYSLESVAERSSWFRLVYPDPEYREEVAREWGELERALDKGGRAEGDQEEPMRVYTVRCADGQDREAEFRLFRMGDRNIVTIMDVTERRRLIAELEAKNAELERFAYTVSHDLKSPLITIKGFASVLESDLRSGDVNRALDDLSRINSAADKMATLLDELLQLSRVGRMTNDPTDLPFTELAREAVELVQGRLDECGAEVTVEPGMPVVRGDRVRLREMLQNLLENAVKFRDAERPLKLEIGVRGSGPGAVFFVRDNGMGIEPRYLEKVFGLFEQLDPSGAGTGIGLALVRRIVEFHGGRIWVESEGVGRGAVFRFTIGGTSER